MSLTEILQIFTFIFGAMIGSFLNVVIHRLPLNQSVVKPRSSCPKCGHMIKWYENIPILSYMLLKGSCSECKTKIPLFYPLIELLCGMFALFLAPRDFSASELTYFAVHFSIAAAFLAHFVIDIKHQLLPDKINIYLLIIILPFVILHKPLLFWIAGGLIGFLGPLGVTMLFYKLRGVVGLGGGDIKLYGILGLLVGPVGILNTIFMSCMLGSIVGLILIVSKKLDKNSPFAFGPYILVVAALQIFFPAIFEQISLLPVY